MEESQGPKTSTKDAVGAGTAADNSLVAAVKNFLNIIKFL